MALTIGQTIDEMHAALRDYIEATYHISHPQLIQQRRELLSAAGVIYQQPYLESTPRYQVGQPFGSLGLPDATLALFEQLSSGGGSVLHNPPWEHQAQALQASLIDQQSLLVTTGTGSGKTECFLLPILAKLATEASRTQDRFGQHTGVRALILYPMNALVNDQLGRLRLLFADPRVVDKFMQWSGRAARFARYTSRTLYPGVRTRERDSRRLPPVIDHFYIDYLHRAAGEPSDDQAHAAQLVQLLREKGKWPAKENLEAWYGRPGSRWQNRQGEFQRCIVMPRDAELFTRHEVHAAAPDILVTNYSMLEYMLMRPLERPIFEQTAAWLEANPDETFLLVVDEAHLYRGAAGAEVALLIRRLRARLNIPSERLQVICTSASFANPDYGIEFAAQLAGKRVEDFAPPIIGTLATRPEAAGSQSDARLLADIDLQAFYGAQNNTERLETVRAFLESRAAGEDGRPLEQQLFAALQDYGPLGTLINRTMQSALPIAELGQRLFPNVDVALADRAATNLIALGSFARWAPQEPSLLPCRVHAFYRGLAGLWACMNPQCDVLAPEQRGGPTGKLYSQPRDACDCGARVLEFFTCRHCGTGYARAYTEELDEPHYLWAEPGGEFRSLAGQLDELHPLDLLIEGEPVVGTGESHYYDYMTGQMDPATDSGHERIVFINSNRNQGDDEPSRNASGPGQFRPCACCGKSHPFGRSSVQDHQTKGDQPFQALVTRQIQVQPPGPVPATPFAPMQGRKVLVFSDSRQTAARLAPNIQKYSMQDVMRPLLISGFNQLQQSDVFAQTLSLESAYLAVLIAAAQLEIRLRPVLSGLESFDEAAEVREAVRAGALSDPAQLFNIATRVSQVGPPESIRSAIMTCITDRYYGIESLGLASITERSGQAGLFDALPDIPTVAESVEQKRALGRLWLRTWATQRGIWLNGTPESWFDTEVRSHSGNFQLVERFLGSTAAVRIFKRNWVPALLRGFCRQAGGANKYRLRGGELTLNLARDWAYCATCRTTQRPYPEIARCINCGHETVSVVDPDTDPVFAVRKGFYRASTQDALHSGRRPVALIAAEHTAQLNSSQATDVFSKAEEHELLFQDVDLGPDEHQSDRVAIDILSCTTTMEVGIDIGALSGVALRNMPPARSNYQQRAGRAGRRGTAVATVIAFGSADSHDEHYFSTPDQMIRGDVEDPRLTLDNVNIARRHVLAYLLQRFHQQQLPNIAPQDQPQLFEVLGTVTGFLERGSVLNRWNFLQWLNDNEEALKQSLMSWLPHELDAQQLLDNLIPQLTEDLDAALGVEPEEPHESADGETSLEVPGEVGEENPPMPVNSENLLDRLLYKGVLPRYAFPTDVATFHVFKPDTNPYYPEFRYTPSQSLSVALSQYAPGKEVWIDNKLWYSSAIYATIPQDRTVAWQRRRMYFECQVCHHSTIESQDEAHRNEMRDCPACGEAGRFGPARPWLRPPGFAHRVGMAEGTTPDDQPARSYATRAKLLAPTPEPDANWQQLNERIRTFSLRDNLLVTNRGPREEGYNYCVACGRIEPSATRTPELVGPHRKPFPTQRDHTCESGAVSTHMVLGTEFPSDVLLISVRVDDPVRLRPGDLSTSVALRTISEAFSTAACQLLGLEALELQAEYRPAVIPDGQMGFVAEIFLYDTLPGGAGFAQRVGDQGIAVMQRALLLLENCPDGCDRSCYRCLRSYKNKFEHDLLDRHLGASLLRYLLTGDIPTLSAQRVNQSTSLLYEDLRRQLNDAIQIGCNVPLTAAGLQDTVAPILLSRTDGVRSIIGIQNPLTPNIFNDSVLQTWSDVSAEYVFIPADELIIRRNLPAMTRQILSQLGLL